MAAPVPEILDSSGVPILVLAAIVYVFVGEGPL
jgi:hypothetical protein